MKKTLKTILSVLLCGSLLVTSVFGASAASASSVDSSGIKSSVTESVANTLNTVFNKTVDKLLGVIKKIIPASSKVQNAEDYVSENFYAGTKDFIDEPAENAKWQLGFSEASIIPDDFSTGKYYKGGYSVNVKFTELLDDLKVRVVALNDGSGRGTEVFAVVDCIGLANSDVRLIRAAVADYAEKNNIVSVNVSATHVHSGIDTQGIYTDLGKSVFKNLLACITGSDNLAPAIDPDFLNLIVSKTAACIKEANENMTTGTLTFAKTDISDYVRDRTAPDISIDELYRLKFAPDNGSRGTIIANMGVHPECIGFKENIATADFVYYTERVVNDAGYNFMFIQGAVGTITESMAKSNDGLELSRIESTIRYGEELGYIIVGMTLTEEECIAQIVDEEREKLAAENEDYTPWYENHVKAEETVVEPILNIKIKEYKAPVDNGVYEVLGKVSLANNTMLKDSSGKIFTVTEVGYMELGKDIKIILSPGETYAELIKGGENMDAFPYECAYDIMGTENVLVFDLMNDAVGYVMPDDYFTYATIRATDDGITIDSSWGLTSLGNHAASNLYGEIYDIYEGVR